VVSIEDIPTTLLHQGTKHKLHNEKATHIPWISVFFRLVTFKLRGCFCTASIVGGLAGKYLGFLNKLSTGIEKGQW